MYICKTFHEYLIQEFIIKRHKTPLILHHHTIIIIIVVKPFVKLYYLRQSQVDYLPGNRKFFFTPFPRVHGLYNNYSRNFIKTGKEGLLFKYTKFSLMMNFIIKILLIHSSFCFRSHPLV